MKTKIIKQEKNPFLHREEIIMEIQTDSAPSFEDIKKEINKDEKVVVVRKIKGNFGTHSFTASIFVYDSPEARKKVETIPKKVKKKLAEEEKTKKQAEKKAREEAQTEETPAQESKQTEETKIEEGNKTE